MNIETIVKKFTKNLIELNQKVQQHSLQNVVKYQVIFTK